MRKRVIVSLLSMAAIVAGARFVAAVAAEPAPVTSPAGPTAPSLRPVDADDRVVLDEGSPWRQFLMRLPRAVIKSSELAGLTRPSDDLENGYNAGGRVGSTQFTLLDTVPGRTAAPPAAWTARSFDDGDWDLVTAAAPRLCRLEIGLFCLRGKFLVSDPAKVRRLLLNMTLQAGGAVVYLNGQEVLRQAMPTGAITPELSGTRSPIESQEVERDRNFRRAGEPLAEWMKRREEAEAARLKQLQLTAELPADKLVKGLNVLAVEFHSWDYAPAGSKASGRPGIQLNQLRLTAQADAQSIATAGQRPAGLAVWNRYVTDVISPLEVPPAGETLRPIRMVAPRNGTCSGQVIVGSDQPILGLSCQLSALSEPTRNVTLPTGAAVLRYGQMTAAAGASTSGATLMDGLAWFQRFGGLVDAPPAIVQVQAPAPQRGAPGAMRPAASSAGAVMPIWILVTVPRDAAAGVYHGTLTISASAAPAPPAVTTVPVELEVADWAAPDPKDFVSQMSIYQSPDTLAAWYDVPLWSERHWQLIERSLALMAQTGNHTIILPLLCKEQMGNEESFVYWVKQADGSYRYDLTVLNRYLDAALKTHDPARIQAVCLVVQSGQAQFGQGRAPYHGLVTQVEGAVKSDLAVPAPDAPEFAAFWKPVLGALQQALQKRGLADRVLLGMPGDVAPPPESVAAFGELLPKAEWFVGCHSGARGYFYDQADKTKIVKAGHVEMVYTPMISDPAEKRQWGWQRQPMVLGFNRQGFYPLDLFHDRCGFVFRILMETDLAANYRGAGRIGADFWELPRKAPASGSGPISSEMVWSMGTVYGRYPASSVGQIGVVPNCAYLLAPGPDGPVASVQFQNLREGIQSAEALICLEKALATKQVSGELEQRCQSMIDERINACREHVLGMGQSRWQDRDRLLYALAAEVAKATGGSTPSGK